MAIELVDKKMKCQECQKEFVFTKGEQAFYIQKAFAEPKRCNDCRKNRKKDRRKKRRTLIKSLRAAEDVKVETVVVSEEAKADTTPVKDSASVGLEPAKPATSKKKK